MKKLFTIAILFTFIAVLSAKETASPEAKAAVASEIVSTKKISGVLLDKATKENLAGAVITVNGQKVYSDLDGKFEISNINNAKLLIKVNMISYESSVVEIDPSNMSNLSIELSQR
ncbi:MAG: carboxypeptidase-like regulatory domain-containing protein [Paludibacter sp.]|nr:carboxypeptidase-like regulatory domain-containing protein [Paludibacter sp.]